MSYPLISQIIAEEPAGGNEGDTEKLQEERVFVDLVYV
jgi:hypothetical protein